MEEVKLNKSKLLEVVRINRNLHIKEYNEAVTGYKVAAIQKIEEVTKDLRKKIDILKTGEFIKILGVTFDLPAPQSHQEEYDQTISMLEDSVDENIVLSRHEYKQYVKDNWDWTGQFKMSHSRYTQH